MYYHPFMGPVIASEQLKDPTMDAEQLDDNLRVIEKHAVKLKRYSRMLILNGTIFVAAIGGESLAEMIGPKWAFKILALSSAVNYVLRMDTKTKLA